VIAITRKNSCWAHIVGIVPLLFVLTGCSTSPSGPTFGHSHFAKQPVSDDKGRIIFYRESDANFGSVTIGIDGSNIGALGHRKFLVTEVAPGTHKLSAWMRYLPLWEFGLDLNVSAGETHYVRASHRTQHMIYPFLGPVGVALVFADTKGEFQLEPVPQGIALVDLQDLTLSQ
jgi:hypothetical protein